MKFFGRFILWCFSLGLFGIIAAAGAVIAIVHHYSQDLPDYKQLADYQPAIATRIHAADGQLMKEFATENRIYVPIQDIPQSVINAFLAAEDKNFYTHPGIDFSGIARAVIVNLKNYGGNQRLVGASTITQQVAKNFLLTNERSFERKIREAILAFRMEKTYSKNRILELYLNEIYLGRGNYGVAAAALNYFDKSLEELTVEEMAYLAALPKAPNTYQVSRNKEETVERRNWVLDRMVANNFISEEDAKLAKEKDLVVKDRIIERQPESEYFAEEVRRFLSQRYGESALYEGGLSVRTSLNPEFQKIAADALAEGLREYDKRHGWRGAIKHFDELEQWQTKLSAMTKPEGAKDWELAIVLELKPSFTTIGLSNGSTGTIPMDSMKWARQWKERQLLGSNITKPSEVFAQGDIILVEKTDKIDVYHLQQIPATQGAIIVLDPHTGRILAMQGGYDYEMSEFNRAVQAKRQPGSSVKPFIYLAALDNGFTPSNLILDAPITIDQGPGLPKWTPTNYAGNYSGLTPLRVGIEKSKNLMTVRLADYLGMETISPYIEKFGVAKDVPPYLSSALGSLETTLYQMVTSYGMLVNGGKKITPTLIDRIQDRNGKTIFRHDARPCNDCGDRISWQKQNIPEIPDTREQLIDERLAYQMVSIMEGVVQRGTAVRAKSLGRPLAGKTGTTNDYKDAWFIGYTPDLVVGTYIGFDEPSTLGKSETGSSVALPVFMKFMEKALKDVPPVPFRIPEGIRLMRVDAKTGRVASPSDKSAIWGAFLPGTEPSEDMLVLDSEGLTAMPTVPGAPAASSQTTAPITGTGGLY